MRRFSANSGDSPRAEASDAKDLVDLAARMGIPPEDAARQVAQMISDANQSDRANPIDTDSASARVAPSS